MNSSYDGIVARLKASPTEDELVVLMNEILQNPPSLQVISTLLTNIIPQTWTLLQPQVQQLVVEALTCYIGVSNLTTRLSVAKHIDLVLIWIDVITKVLQQPEMVVKLVDRAQSRLEVKEVDKLLFKGKLIAIVNEKSVEYSLGNNIPNYHSWLCQSLLSLYKQEVSIDTINQFLKSFVSFNTGDLEYYFEYFITPDNFQYFRHSYTQFKSLDQKDLVLKLYRFHLIKCINPDSILAWYNLVKFIQINDYNLIVKIILMMNHSLNILTCLLIPHDNKQSLANQLLASWSDCKNSPISVQEYTTHFLIHLMSSVPLSYIDSLMKQEVFLVGVSNHLESYSTNIKSLGVILADKICQFNQQPKIFQSQLNLDSYEYLVNEKILVIKSIDNQTSWAIVGAPKVEEPDSLTSVNQEVALINVDSDDESDEDDQMAHKSIIPKPLYIKQLLDYLHVDSKKERAYEMQKMALTICPTLIRQKSLNSNEIKFYGEDLLTTIIGMSNDFAIKKFNDLILLNLIAVLVSNPKLTIFLLKLLLTGDYSLQQRMIILSSMSLSCRELRGYSDDIVAQSFDPKTFSSQILPQKLHDYYLGGIDTIERSIQGTLMAEPSERAQDTLSGGKVLRVSRRLTKTPVQVNKPKLPNFFKQVGPTFYFPLINVWYESDGINIGHYSPILISHYIKTLTLILNTAYPSAPDLQDMIKEFLLIVTPCFGTILVDQIPSIESIVTGLLLICDISDGEFLIQNFSNELRIIETWLSTHWGEIIDNRVSALCSGLLLQLHEMSDKFERTLMSQINGLY